MACSTYHLRQTENNKTPNYSEINSNRGFIVFKNSSLFKDDIEQMLSKMKLYCYGFNNNNNLYWGKKNTGNSFIEFSIKIMNNFENNIHVTVIVNGCRKDSQKIDNLINSIVSHIKQEIYYD